MAANPTPRRAALVTGGLTFAEGPRWRDGRLYVSDFYDRQVLALAPDTAPTVVCAVPGQPSGLGFAPDGDLLVVSMTDRRLLRLHDRELSEVADLSAYAAFHCNDMCVDKLGRAYVGNFGSDGASGPFAPTVLLRVDPDGAVAVAAEGLLFPNGTVITPDGGTLIVAETFAFRISAFDVAADGGLSNRRTWAAFGADSAHDLDAALATRAIAPDGICLDAEGALWVADALGSGAHRVRRGGEILDTVDLGGVTAYAVELGGDDGRTLYLCAGPRLGAVDPATGHHGSVMSVRIDVPGVAWA